MSQQNMQGSEARQLSNRTTPATEEVPRAATIRAGNAQVQAHLTIYLQIMISESGKLILYMD